MLSGAVANGSLLCSLQIPGTIQITKYMYNLSKLRKIISRGRGYGLKKWAYLQILPVSLFYGVILVSEKGKKNFFQKFSFLAVCPQKN